MDEATHDELLQGEAHIWKHIFSFANSMALKCAVELGIPDILHSHNRPLSLPEIASNIFTNSSSYNSSPHTLNNLSRIMRLLVHNQIFTSTISHDSDGISPPVTLYALTAASRWLVRSGQNELSLSPLLLLENTPWMLNPWQNLSTCVKEGGCTFQKAHNGRAFYDVVGKEPEFMRVFYDAMKHTGNITMKKVLSSSRVSNAIWEGLESVVDVGGGTGSAIAEIVKTYPRIKGINFDLPQVIEIAPEHAGVTHVAGDMFDAIPSAQALFLKWILHNWDDENCVKILKNCGKALPEKTGKLIIVDLVLKPDDDDDIFGSTGMAFDLQMLVNFQGLERTEVEWKNLLEKGGFPRYKITKIPDLFSIIEAFPSKLTLNLSMPFK
ncbi:OLC1v1030116C1 [Oldenlandia corymbosa var. corymbosa]|uniref:OLC1v1030116C1 n=1 Tax=Oldenlandia corymbosa var. corymbosa TaxID=529605 RepID=A0AAV1CG37_OLDCO|nr:OLC1v1030116C1 [Oldenlandia corymbosa var. corymbosa]